MERLSWKLFKRSYPFICDACKGLHWEKRDVCENCGKHDTLRQILRVDYKLWKRRLN